MTLDVLFDRPVVTAEPDRPVAGIAELMQDKGVGAVVLVGDGGRPVGIVTDRDIALALGTGRVLRSEPVRTVMASPVMTIDRDAGVLAATRRFHDMGLRRLPIVDATGRLVGLVQVDDLLQLLGREIGDLTKGITHALALAG